MIDEQNSHTQSMMNQADTIIAVLSNENIDSTIQYAPNGIYLQEEGSISAELDTPTKFAFDFKKFRFNNQHTFMIYAFILCVTLSQEILSSASFLELQLKKIKSHSPKTQSGDEYIAYMKWSGMIFTMLQLFSVYFFGSLLDRRGVRFSVMLFLLCFFVSKVMNLYLMSDYYNFNFYSYIPCRLIASMDGGFVVLVTIINSGITNLFESHTKRMLYFNYLYSLVGIITFVIPFITTFIIKRFGNYCTLQVEAIVTFFTIAFVQLFLNDKSKKTAEIKDNDIIAKQQVEITKKTVQPTTSLLSQADVFLAETNIIKKIIKQFEVFILPKNTGIARKNVLLLELFKILSSADQATINVGISYLMIAHDFTAVELNYIISFFGFYGCVASFVGIRVFYYIINKFTNLKASAHYFDRIDKTQLLITSGASLAGFTLAIVCKGSWLGQILMLVCFETFVSAAPILSNGIIKIIENQHEYVKLYGDEENSPLFLNNAYDDEEDFVYEEFEPVKSKTAIIFSCYTIQDKITTALFGALLFQVFEMTRDTKPWFFYVVSGFFALVNFIIAQFVKPVA